MNGKMPRIISFVSGKGGSGKTTVTISITKLLSELGHPCLYIDFDLATNGASYFFKNYFTSEKNGIWERLCDINNGQVNDISRDRDVIKIGENFFFVPSRSNLRSKGKSNEAIFDKMALKEKILLPLIGYASEHKIDYVLVDCQAGYSLPTIVGAEVSDMTVIVTEADSISSDAADNLLIQIGESLPDERKYLVNKLDVRDAETYKNMRNVFQTLNRLPPLPFDFEVRNAFGARQIPIDINNPSPLLFALFETAKYIFTEIYDEITAYKNKNIDAVFDRYDQELKSLLSKKEALERKRSEIRESKFRWRGKRADFYVAQIIVVLFFMTAIGLVSIGGNGDLLTALRNLWSEQLGMAIGMAAFFGALGWLIYWRSAKRRAVAYNEMDFELSGEITKLDRDLDNYRSLLLARTKDYIIDAEVAKSRIGKSDDGLH